MKVFGWTPLYAFAYYIVRMGRKTFFSKIESHGTENVPKDKPVLFAANHQCAFMDPVMLAVNFYKPSAFLVRADVFKKKAVANMFAQVNMMPIYRQRDGADSLDKNEAIFNQCYDILGSGNNIIIFPEGNQGADNRLRPLKKGVFRIGFGALEKYKNSLDIQVIPVGINYSNQYNKGAKLLVNFGEAIPLNKYLRDGEATPTTLNEGRAELAGEMSKLILDIQNKEFYHLINFLTAEFSDEIQQAYPHTDKPLLKEFKSQKQFITRAEEWVEDNNEKATELQSITKGFDKELRKKGLRFWLLKENNNGLGLRMAFLILALPIFSYGLINSIIPYSIPDKFIKKNIKDIQFYSSIRMAMGVLLFTIFWGIQTLIVSLFTDNYISAIYAASLPITGWITWKYYLNSLKVRGINNYNKIKNTELGQQLKADYNKLSSALNEILGK